jgi:hypothetical protein
VNDQRPYGLWARLDQSLRRLFFAFDSPLRRRLWAERLRLAHANGYQAADGTRQYAPLSDAQRKQLATLHATLGSRGPTLLSLEAHHRFEGWVQKAGGTLRRVCRRP